MDWTAVAAVAEIIGLALVVISLVFVGFQLRQNTRQLRQENLLKTVRGTLDTNWSYHRDENAFRVFREACRDFVGLEPHDQALFHSIAMDLSFYLEVVAQMCRAGLIDRSALEINERFFLGILVTPGGAQWWDVVRRTRPMPQPAIDRIQAMLDDPDRSIEPVTDLQPWLRID